MSSNRLQQLFSFYEDNPKDSFICFAIAKEYEKLENIEKALEFYLGIQNNDPEYVGTYYHLGKLYEQQQDLAKAFQTYKEGMVIANRIGDQHALSELAGAKLALGDDDDF